MSDLDWSDLRHALAIGRAGSLAGAARQLGVNATTVQRRLESLETRLGARLFDRSRSGYLPTEAGVLLLEQARRMADQADEIERRVLGRGRELTGPLRVATAFVVMEHLLPQRCPTLRAPTRASRSKWWKTPSWWTCRAATPKTPPTGHARRPTWRCACPATWPSIWWAASSA